MATRDSENNVALPCYDDMDPGAYLDALFYDPLANEQTWLYYPYPGTDESDLDEWLKSVRVKPVTDGNKNSIGSIASFATEDSVVPSISNLELETSEQNLDARTESPKAFADEPSFEKSPVTGLPYDPRTFTRPKKMPQNQSLETCTLLENVSNPWKNITLIENSTFEYKRSFASSDGTFNLSRRLSKPEPQARAVVNDTFSLSTLSSNSSKLGLSPDPIISEEFRPFKASTPANSSGYKSRRIHSPTKTLRRINTSYAVRKQADISDPKNQTNLDDGLGDTSVRDLSTHSCQKQSEPDAHDTSITKDNRNANETFPCLANQTKNLSKSDSNIFESSHTQLVPITNQTFNCTDKADNSVGERRTSSSYHINKLESPPRQRIGTSRIPLGPPPLKSKSRVSTSSLDISHKSSNLYGSKDRCLVKPKLVKHPFTTSLISLVQRNENNNDCKDQRFQTPLKEWNQQPRLSMMNVKSTSNPRLSYSNTNVKEKEQASDQKNANTTVTKPTTSGIPRPTPSRLPVLKSQLPIGRFRKPPSS